MFSNLRIGMLRKEDVRLGQRVLVGRERGRVDAITQSVVAVFMEDGRYVLARWEDGVYEA